MPMTKKDVFALTAGAILLVGITAGASAYYLNNDGVEDNSASQQVERVTYVQPQSAPVAQQPVQQQPVQQRTVACDDDNIVGKVLGGVGGGLLGSRVGKGGGKTAATIGGSVGGTLIGEELIPTKNVTCR